jgi:ATP/maltotriose-dependent transcriptional regulator MalT/DNA-binding CsgD family transcriptional regulator
VLDDLQGFSHDDAALEVLARVVVDSIGRIRWIISSRDVPALPMGTWIAHGYMSLPITSDDLRFTMDDARALAVAMNVRIGESELSEIVNDVVGWPIAVRLALDLWNRQWSWRAIRTRTRDALFDVFDAEVWRAIPTSLRLVAYACSVVPEPESELLRTVGIQPHDIEQVADRVPFVQVSDAKTAVVHDLFREFVVSRMVDTPEGRRLNEAFAEALPAYGRPRLALHLAITIGAVAPIRAVLVERAFELIECGERDVVERAVAILTRDGAYDPVAEAVQAAFRQAADDTDNAARMYAHAISEGLPDLLRCDVSMRLAALHVSRGNAAAASDLLPSLTRTDGVSLEKQAEARGVCATVHAASGRADEAKHLIASVEGSLAIMSPVVRARSLQRLGFASYYLGDLFNARKFALDGAVLAESLGMDVTAAHAYSTLYSIAAYREATNEGALSYARLQADAAERAGHISLRVYALRALHSLLAESGDVAAAREVERTINELPDSQAYRDGLLSRVARAVVSLSEGRIPEAYALVAGSHEDRLTPHERAFRSAFIACILLILRRRSEAMDLIARTPLVPAASDFFSKRFMSFAAAYRGLALWATDRSAQARRALNADFSYLPARDVLMIATIKDIVMLPHPLADSSFVADLRRSLAKAGLDGYGAMIEMIAAPNSSGFELTEKEMETLRAFHDTGGTVSEVAEYLGKSRYTVDHQVKSAIRKIGCSGRAEALAVARRMGLFSAR